MKFPQKLFSGIHVDFISICRCFIFYMHLQYLLFVFITPSLGTLRLGFCLSLYHPEVWVRDFVADFVQNLQKKIIKFITKYVIMNWHHLKLHSESWSELTLS